MLDRDSYAQGFADGVAFAREQLGISQRDIALSNIRGDPITISKGGVIRKKRKRSPKQKILDDMTQAKWKQYKKGKGKKTYLQIRAEVSRSQAYKRKTRNM